VTGSRIAVVGAGGVGGYFGVRLAEAGGDVHFIARGEHLRAIRERGLEVRSVAGDVVVHPPATDRAEEVGPVDAVLFCVKSYDTADAIPFIAPLVSADTAVVPFLNGIDHLDALRAAIGAGHVLGGAAYLFARVSAPGVVEHTGGPGVVAFGELDGRISERVEGLRKLCRTASILHRDDRDILVVMWEKLAFICAQAGMTATARASIGEIRESPESWAMFRRIASEVVEVARGEGVPVHPDSVEMIVSFAEQLNPEAHSSLYDDLVAGRRLELEALHGAVVRRARRLELDVPATQSVYALLEPSARGRGRVS
jgi:2-dehydropantoate 2-reductase